MRFLFAILSALALILSLSSAGSAAYAAVAPCAQQDVQVMDHADGGAKEPAGCPMSGTAHHHHASCNALVGVAPVGVGLELALQGSSVRAGRYDAALSGLAPPSLLRPPIA